MEKIKNLRSRSKYGDSGSNGLIDKITRRYSSVSNKLLRRTPGRLGSPQPVSQGSYDMTGIESEDHRIEIGAPILISKTYIDDNLDTMRSVKEVEEVKKSPNDSITSEEEYVDARDTFSFNKEVNDDKDDVSHGRGSYDVTPDQRPQSPPPPPPPPIKFLQLGKQSPPLSEICSTPPPLPDSSPPDLTPELTPIVTPHYSPDITPHVSPHVTPKESPATTPQPQEIERPFIYRAVRSKSAQNLHKSEMQVYLERSPSLMNHSPNGTLTRKCIAPKQTSSQSDIESDYTLNNNDIHYLSKVSFDDQDFDLKSISFESLHISNNEHYESLRDINWIREEFDRSINLEYCEHRNNLKPCERRITLLRHKNNRLVNLDGKKERITNAWSGLKNWIGDEKSKIKEVVQKHAAMQRVGAGNIIKNQAFFDKMKKDDGVGGSRACKTCDAHSENGGGTLNKEWDEESAREATISRTTSEVSTRDGSEEKNTRNAVKKSIHDVSIFLRFENLVLYI